MGVQLCGVDALERYNPPPKSPKRLTRVPRADASVWPRPASASLEAVDDLRALFGLRVWRQHAGTEDRAARGVSRLGISLPVYECGAARQHMQSRTVAALSAGREEAEHWSRPPELASPWAGSALLVGRKCSSDRKPHRRRSRPSSMRRTTVPRAAAGDRAVTRPRSLDVLDETYWARRARASAGIAGSASSTKRPESSGPSV